MPEITDKELTLLTRAASDLFTRESDRSLMNAAVQELQTVTQKVVTLALRMERLEQTQSRQHEDALVNAQTYANNARDVATARAQVMVKELAELGQQLKDVCEDICERQDTSAEMVRRALSELEEQRQSSDSVEASQGEIRKKSGILTRSLNVWKQKFEEYTKRQATIRKEDRERTDKRLKELESRIEALKQMNETTQE